MTARTCAWCRGPIPEDLRSDAICCSTRCRQARHRFTAGVGRPVASHRGEPLRLAYADPPYPGLSKRYYGDHPDFAGEVDHAELLERLSEYDGWALSTAARSLPAVLALCPPGVKVAAWVRGARYGRSAGPRNAWEPVIYFGGRVSPDVERDASRAPGERVAHGRRVVQVLRDGSPVASSGRATRRIGDRRDASRHAGDGRRIDALVYAARPRLTDPNRVVGAKPAAFCRWVFELLGATPGDQMDDLYPGSGGVARAWQVYGEAA